jgi:hypothetical protein
MAFLRPANLIPITFCLQSDGDATYADEPLGVIYFDAKVFYINFMTHDTDASFTGGTAVLEWDDNADGTETVIDSIVVADSTLKVDVDLDGLTSTAVIPAGSRIQLTIPAGFTNDSGFTVILWVQNMDNGQ